MTTAEQEPQLVSFFSVAGNSDNGQSPEDASRIEDSSEETDEERTPAQEATREPTPAPDNDAESVSSSLQRDLAEVLADLASDPFEAEDPLGDTGFCENTFTEPGSSGDPATLPENRPAESEDDGAEDTAEADTPQVEDNGAPAVEDVPEGDALQVADAPVAKDVHEVVALQVVDAPVDEDVHEVVTLQVVDAPVDENVHEVVTLQVVDAPVDEDVHEVDPLQVLDAPVDEDVHEVDAAADPPEDGGHVAEDGNMQEKDQQMLDKFYKLGENGVPLFVDHVTHSKDAVFSEEDTTLERPEFPRNPDFAEALSMSVLLNNQQAMRDIEEKRKGKVRADQMVHGRILEAILNKFEMDSKAFQGKNSEKGTAKTVFKLFLQENNIRKYKKKKKPMTLSTVHGYILWARLHREYPDLHRCHLQKRVVDRHQRYWRGWLPKYYDVYNPGHKDYNEDIIRRSDKNYTKTFQSMNGEDNMSDVFKRICENAAKSED